MYKLKYLPIARQDLVDIINYISHNLKNPIAAEKLAVKVTKEINKLKTFPHINTIYTPVRPLNFEYRRLLVRNYIVFYYIDEKQKLIIIARVIYARRDYEKLL